MKKRITMQFINKLCLITFVGTLSFAICIAEVFAQPKKPNIHHLPGKAIHRLPSGHRTVYVGKSKYYVHGGSFYVRKPSGFFVVRAPLGAVLVSMPIGARVMLIGGITYYVFNDVYYRRAPEGYVVVAPPSNVAVVNEASPVVPLQQVAGEKVIVNASMLNVRSGPGLNFPVVQTIRRYVTISVHGYAPEWLYVKLADGTYGWVMLRFTSAYGGNASG